MQRTTKIIRTIIYFHGEILSIAAVFSQPTDSSTTIFFAKWAFSVRNLYLPIGFNAYDFTQICLSIHIQVSVIWEFLCWSNNSHTSLTMFPSAGWTRIRTPQILSTSISYVFFEKNALKYLLLQRWQIQCNNRTSSSSKIIATSSAGSASVGLVYRH